jgi:hypothetical protein
MKALVLCGLVSALWVSAAQCQTNQTVVRQDPPTVTHPAAQPAAPAASTNASAATPANPAAWARGTGSPGAPPGSIITVGAHPTSPAISPATQARSDQLSILENERKATIALIDAETRAPKSTADASAKVLARLTDDLRTLDREIAYVAQQPIYQSRFISPVPQPLSLKTDAQPITVLSASKSASPAANPAAVVPAPAQELVTYEGWDVFKNFGKKVSKNE